MISTIIAQIMSEKRFRLIYDTEFIAQLKAIERKHHALIRNVIETQLSYEPDTETRNRKLLNPPTAFGARWELRFGNKNQFRIFYSTYPETAEVRILAIGVKHRERLYIGGKEVKI